MAFISVKKSSNIRASINYILKDEQTGHGLLIDENNCNQFNFEKLIYLDEENFRKKERNINSIYKNNEESYLDSLRSGRGIQVLQNNSGIYAYTGYISFSSEDDISLSDARDITSEALKKTLGEDARFIVASHTQGRNIHAHFVCENGRSVGIQPRDFIFKNLLKEKTNEVCKERGLSSIYESMLYNRNRPKMTSVERMERKKRNPKEKFYTLNDRVSNSLKRNIFSCQFRTTDEIKKALEKEGYKIEGEKIYPQYRNVPVFLSHTRFNSWKKIKKILEELNKLNEKKLKEVFKMHEIDDNLRKNHKDYFREAIQKISARDMYLSKDNVELENILTLEDEVEFIKDANEKELEFRLTINEDEDPEEEMEKEVQDLNQYIEKGRETVNSISNLAKENKEMTKMILKYKDLQNISDEERKSFINDLKVNVGFIDRKDIPEDEITKDFTLENNNEKSFDEDFNYEPDNYEPDFYHDYFEDLKEESLKQNSYKDSQNIEREL